MTASTGSPVPYVAIVGNLVGLAVLLYGVNIHNYTPQVAGGALVIISTMVLSYHVFDLPEVEHSGH